jgi:hypothetical protein
MVTPARVYHLSETVLEAADHLLHPPDIQVLRQQDSMQWRSVNSQARPRRRNR